MAAISARICSAVWAEIKIGKTKIDVTTIKTIKFSKYFFIRDLLNPNFKIQIISNQAQNPKLI
ncbi:MAG: hypothetical protein A2Y98_03930 [Candidatus Portnoybacteria bacterium RBG_19FT_COMBO_36_7]|uniref:Uncharacterized protein n=1 Tax=Candidatus Portnoybacteria bacterium RBG_19FT_COMBO_36_7 TaxID=1801992 RepID=A0A1G2FA17_9BACT|nr:MAG: hypothetical protein A2Y98_03930 [Candidatus Portnoybacteria bacterium RBG_19FT_COMBO_36_7]